MGKQQSKVNQVAPLCATTGTNAPDVSVSQSAEETVRETEETVANTTSQIDVNKEAYAIPQEQIHRNEVTVELVPTPRTPPVQRAVYSVYTDGRGGVYAEPQTDNASESKVELTAIEIFERCAAKKEERQEKQLEEDVNDYISYLAQPWQI